MKRAVILHGTNADHTQNWFPWTKQELEKLGYEVWVPDLPGADHPNLDTYIPFLKEQDWDFNDNLVIGHSSGAVTILGLLQALQKGVKIDAAILVGAFTQRLADDPSWEMLRGLFSKPFDYKAIKQKAKRFIFIHSPDDPYCPIEDARWLCKQVGGEFIEIPGSKHFSVNLDPRFNKFPELIDLIKQKVLH
jgi:predicted alpha/beta hydrolase family esterase